VDARCEDCQHGATVNVDALPDSLYVPDVALRMRCSACGSKRIDTRPNGREHGGRGWGRGLKWWVIRCVATHRFSGPWARLP
jgi:hypothetical protein